MKTPAIILIVIGILLAGSMIYLDGYDSILLFISEKTEAHVVSYAQDSPGAVREGDWRLVYEFSTPDGAVHRGETTYAPKKRLQAEVRKVKVRYLGWLPGVSGVEGNISTTGLAGFLFAGWCLVTGIRSWTRPVSLPES